MAAPPEKVKEDKKKDKDKKKQEKKQEKKPGMLSGLFKRKDRKSKHQDDDGDDVSIHEKVSEESSRRNSPVPKLSEEMSATDSQPSPSGSIDKGSAGATPKAAGKLQKSPPPGLAVNKEQAPAQVSAPPEKPSPPQSIPPPERQAPTIAPQGPSSMRSTERDFEPRAGDKPPSLRVRDQPNVDRSVKHSNSQAELRQQQAQAQAQMLAQRKDSDGSNSSSSTVEEYATPAAEISELRSLHKVNTNDSRQGVDRLSESPVQVVSPIAEPSHQQQQAHGRLPALVADSSSQEDSRDAAVSPVSPPSSPEMVDAPEMHGSKGSEDDDEISDGRVVASSTATPTWSDASLRMYLEDDNDIRDLLVVVHDKSGVEPAGPDHPFMKGLFREEKAQLADMTDVSVSLHYSVRIQVMVID